MPVCKSVYRPLITYNIVYCKAVDNNIRLYCPRKCTKNLIEIEDELLLLLKMTLIVNIDTKYNGIQNNTRCPENQKTHQHGGL